MGIPGALQLQKPLACSLREIGKQPRITLAIGVRGTPIQTPKYYKPFYKDTQNGTPNFGQPPEKGEHVGFKDILNIMKDQMEKSMEHETVTGFI